MTDTTSRATHGVTCPAMSRGNPISDSPALSLAVSSCALFLLITEAAVVRATCNGGKETPMSDSPALSLALKALPSLCMISGITYPAAARGNPISDSPFSLARYLTLPAALAFLFFVLKVWYNIIRWEACLRMSRVLHKDSRAPQTRWTRQPIANSSLNATSCCSWYFRYVGILGFSVFGVFWYFGILVFSVFQYFWYFWYFAILGILCILCILCILGILVFSVFCIFGILGF